VLRSCRRTQLRNVSEVHPILPAMEEIADHCDSCSPACSKTIRTARSRTSGEYLTRLLMAPSSQDLEPPVNPGRFSGSVVDELKQVPEGNRVRNVLVQERDSESRLCGRADRVVSPLEYRQEVLLEVDGSIRRLEGSEAPQPPDTK